MRALRSLALVAMTALVASCGGSDDGPQSGVLVLSLDTPNTGDGAILFRVTGTVDSAQRGVMVQDASYGVGATFSRFVAAGNLTDGPMIYLFVPDVDAIADYVVTVEQVAVKATNAQRSLAGYSVSVAVDE